MKRILTTAIAFLLTTSAIVAQNPTLKKINDIKRQRDAYFWCETNHANADSALAYATFRLLDEVNSHRSSVMTLADLQPLTKHIRIDRGSQTRIFVYARKDEVARGTAISPTPSPATSTTNFVPDAFTQKIIERKTFNSIYQYLRALKAGKQILLFGPLKDVSDYTELHLIVFDIHTQQVITILSPLTQNQTRVNLLTGVTDSLENYPQDMVAVIWYMK